MKSPQGRELRAISARLRDEAQTLLDQANALDVLADAAVLARVSEFADVEPVWLEHLGPREAQDGPPAG
jgi:hypothetical protein